MRELILAFQFLTRLPMPRVQDCSATRQARAVVWFPLVGLVIGAGLAGVMSVVADPRLAAFFALLVWIWVTGALHLDGLADMADALGASHRDPERFLAVLSDPHIGTFGVVTLILQVAGKGVLLWVLFGHAQSHPETVSLLMASLVLIPAWSRWGAWAWSWALPPLKPGLAERFQWQGALPVMGAWFVVLSGFSAWLAPGVLMAPLGVLLWGLYLRRRLGGVTGDCLGAGIEVTESAQLLGLLIWLGAL